MKITDFNTQITVNTQVNDQHKQDTQTGDKSNN